MSETALRLAVIVGSTREGRFAETVSAWFAEQAHTHNDMDVDVIDLADAGLPAVHPAEATPPLQDFAARLDAADAFVIVTPEYNHGYPASLKFAIDSAYREWNAKPVGFVSYGGISGGLRAVEQLRQIFAELHAVTVRDTVSFHGVWGQFGEDGNPVDAEGVNQAAKKMLDQLVWWGRATRDARTHRPYAA
ncbi:NAD(P)H-dependent oxidoreductase [Saccharopolyspora erythraea]|uniref:NADPH-dependent FMN reductase n=1 Tax=Saccharopolyspora erythraea TaxID=1836 RepID=UPI001BAC4568|nr:NAD(P)H-dependent oxidoreductase [Saccharopolyspora erythraea]QUH01123.1 NAD(P)H-dependent oxidoreductase [Saccharopolyspora erythraea]